MDVDLTINKNPAFLQPASEWQSYMQLVVSCKWALIDGLLNDLITSTI